MSADDADANVDDDNDVIPINDCKDFCGRMQIV